jgi:5'-nucleotidase/UDP-sugar diphosphatase
VKRQARLLISAFFLLFLTAAVACAQPVRLTILHTNDTHGHLMPFSYPSVAAPGSELSALKVRTDIGGIARRATLAKRLRAELAKQGTTVWLVDGGDFSDGTPFSTEYHGEADAAAMNAAEYTFGALGNHEFNNPLPRLISLVKLFRYPVLCANAIQDSTGRPLFQASEIRQLGPLKIGLFGLVTRETAGYEATREGITIAGEIETAKRMVSTLRRDVDIVIAISHSGERVDEKMAESVSGLDVIIGAHSHSRLPVGEMIWHSDELKPKDINGTIVVQAHQWGGELGRLDLLFDKNESGAWVVERYRARLVPITSEIPDDKTVAAIVERYWKPIAAHYDELIGNAAADFIFRGDDLTPYNLFADAVRARFKTEVDLEELGGIRSELPKGRITRADLINMDPFDSNVFTGSISGRRLKETLLRHRPAVSGVRYRIENGKLAYAAVGGRSIIDTRMYTVSTNSYFAGVALKDLKLKDSGKKRFDIAEESVRQAGTVKPVFDGRRVIID